MRLQVLTAIKYFTVVLGLVINDLKELHASIFTVKYLTIKAEGIKHAFTHTFVSMCKCIFMCEYMLSCEHGTVTLVACCSFTTSVVW
jgi:hypothetical protein